VSASTTGTGGNYAGVMTYAPWVGTTASTGDASYQLAFGSTASNGGGIPELNIRKGIDSTWNAWYTLVMANSSGYVGIGTTSPLDLFHAYSSANNALVGVQAGAQSYWAMEAVNASNALYIGPLASTHNVTPVISALASGNVGIGTTGPGALLDVNGNGLYRNLLRVQGSVTVPSGASAIGLELFQSSNNAYVQSFDRTNSVYSPLYFAGSQFVFQNSNVGIGTANPNGKLTIVNNVYTAPLGGSYGQYQILLYDGGAAGSSYGMGVEPFNIGFNSAGGYKFYQGASSTPLMVIGGQSSSNVGIGLPSPHGPLDVSTNLNGTIGAGNGVSDGIVFYQSADNSSTIQSYIDGSWSNRTTYAGPCCNTLNINTDVGAVVIGNNTANNGISLNGPVTASGTVIGVSSTWSGTVGIGVTSPTATLDITRPASTVTDIHLLESGQAEATLGHLSGDSNFYITNTYGLGAGGLGTAAKSITLANTGSVGIGLTNPSAQLHLFNSTHGGDLGIGQQGDSTPYMRLGIDSSYNQYMSNNAYWTGTAYNYVATGGYGGLASEIEQSSGVIQFNTASGGTNPIAWNNRMYIANGGNVGIGNTSPSTALQVTGTVTATQFVGGGAGLTGVAASFSGLTSGDLCTASGTTAIICNEGYTGSGSTVVLATSPTITTPTISGILTGSGAGSAASYGAITVAGSKNGWGGINFNSGSGNMATLMVSGDTVGFFNAANSAWDWYWTAGTLTSGTVPAANVSAGTFSGSYTITGNATVSGATLTGHVEQLYANYIWPGRNDGSGVNYQTSWYLASNSSYGLYTNTGIYIAGNAYAANYYHTSDRRLKDNIKPIQGLAIVDKLNGVTFTWKKDGKPSAGVIAQDVEKVLPEAIFKDKDGMMMVSYDALIGPMIEAVKQLHAMMFALETKFDGMMADIKGHDERIFKLEATVMQLQAANDNNAKEIAALHQEIAVMKGGKPATGAKP
jgi:hypothetical protein